MLHQQSRHLIISMDGEPICGCRCPETTAIAEGILREAGRLSRNEFTERIRKRTGYSTSTAYKIIMHAMDYLMRHGRADKLPDPWDPRRTWYVWGSRKEHIIGIMPQERRTQTGNEEA